ncbi:MAG: geranylgeranylglycerol-phosphate geranylgeranyltransferase, partial [Flavobacteriales bacterium]|nr:geranylgeranylglycerol-phosphate geranylgeranyltransferase [Flavobacteriales bacterium]
MKSLIDFFRLLRPLNLLIIAGTMYAMRWWVLYPLVNNEQLAMEFQVSEMDFFLSVLVMILLAAAGNIINDYFDVKVDRINKPDRVIVGKTVKRRVAMVSHHAINILAVLIAGYLGWKYARLYYAIIPAFMAGSLWYYSLVFKKQTLIGNFVVAIMVAIVPLWSGLFDLISLADHYGEFIQNTGEYFGALWKWLIGFSLFAFILTLIREAQKDLEDLEGDAAGQFRTLPLTYGVSASHLYVGMMSVLFLIGLAYATLPI